MPVKYPLRDEPGKTMFIFEKNGKYYGHIVKNKTAKEPARIVFETPLFGTVEQIKQQYPEHEEEKND